MKRRRWSYVSEVAKVVCFIRTSRIRTHEIECEKRTTTIADAIASAFGVGFQGLRDPAADYHDVQ